MRRTDTYVVGTTTKLLVGTSTNIVLDQLNHFENYPEFGTMINIAWEKMALTKPIAATIIAGNVLQLKYHTF